MSEIGENLVAVRQRIRRAADAAGRSEEEIKLIAVSKSHPAERLLQAIEAGAQALGENKLQEADGKIKELGRAAAEWHLIGHLQSNKARRAVQLFDVIHSVDSLGLGLKLERICNEEGREDLPVLVQVDLAGEATKAGTPVYAVGNVIDALRDCRRLRVIGLMAIPPFFSDAELVRPYFRKLRELRDELLPGGDLSMGMSHDLEQAVQEGSTMVRIGTAIFGSRGN